jgi:hypothetical protein
MRITREKIKKTIKKDKKVDPKWIKKGLAPSKNPSE